MTSDDIARVVSAEHSGPPPAAPAEQAGGQAVPPGVGDARAARRARWREAVSIATELAGIGVLSAGFWLLRPWAGLIVLGVGLIALGFASSPRFDRHAGPQ